MASAYDSALEAFGLHGDLWAGAIQMPDGSVFLPNGEEHGLYVMPDGNFFPVSPIANTPGMFIIPGLDDAIIHPSQGTFVKGEDFRAFAGAYDPSQNWAALNPSTNNDQTPVEGETNPWGFNPNEEYATDDDAIAAYLKAVHEQSLAPGDPLNRGTFSGYGDHPTYMFDKGHVASNITPQGGVYNPIQEQTPELRQLMEALPKGTPTGTMGHGGGQAVLPPHLGGSVGPQGMSGVNTAYGQINPRWGVVGGQGGYGLGQTGINYTGPIWENYPGSDPSNMPDYDQNDGMAYNPYESQVSIAEWLKATLGSETPQEWWPEWLRQMLAGDYEGQPYTDPKGQPHTDPDPTNPDPTNPDPNAPDLADDSGMKPPTYDGGYHPNNPGNDPFAFNTQENRDFANSLRDMFGLDYNPYSGRDAVAQTFSNAPVFSHQKGLGGDWLSFLSYYGGDQTNRSGNQMLPGSRQYNEATGQHEFVFDPLFGLHPAMIPGQFRDYISSTFGTDFSNTPELWMLPPDQIEAVTRRMMEQRGLDEFGNQTADYNWDSSNPRLSYWNDALTSMIDDGSLSDFRGAWRPSTNPLLGRGTWKNLTAKWLDGGGTATPNANSGFGVPIGDQNAGFGQGSGGNPLDPMGNETPDPVDPGSSDPQPQTDPKGQPSQGGKSPHELYPEAFGWRGKPGRQSEYNNPPQSPQGHNPFQR